MEGESKKKMPTRSFLLVKMPSRRRRWWCASQRTRLDSMIDSQTVGWLPPRAPMASEYLKRLLRAYADMHIQLGTSIDRAN